MLMKICVRAFSCVMKLNGAFIKRDGTQTQARLWRSRTIDQHDLSSVTVIARKKHM